MKKLFLTLIILSSAFLFSSCLDLFEEPVECCELMKVENWVPWDIYFEFDRETSLTGGKFYSYTLMTVENMPYGEHYACIWDDTREPVKIYFTVNSKHPWFHVWYDVKNETYAFD